MKKSEQLKFWVNFILHTDIELVQYLYCFHSSGIARKDGELSYFIQFNDVNEPILINCSASRIWSALIFDFLMEKMKYDGFTSDPNRAAINVLNETADVHGGPEIVCKYRCRLMHRFPYFYMCQTKFNISMCFLRFLTDVTDIMADTNFLLKFQNGYKFQKATNVKKDFAELAVVFLEANLEIE